VILAGAASARAAQAPRSLDLIPAPRQLKRRTGEFTVTRKTEIVLQSKTAQRDHLAAEILAAEIERINRPLAANPFSRSLPRGRNIIYLGEPQNDASLARLLPIGMNLSEPNSAARATCFSQGQIESSSPRATDRESSTASPRCASCSGQMLPAGPNAQPSKSAIGRRCAGAASRTISAAARSRPSPTWSSRSARSLPTKSTCSGCTWKRLRFPR